MGQCGFANAGRTEEQHVLGVPDVVAGGQVEDFFFSDGGIEAPVESSNGLRPTALLLRLRIRAHPREAVQRR